ncbi:MAG: cytochrome b [Alphaproteobacteria bacterium]|nr:cytochrome b [Alphaproteobacteria bacterium]MBV9371436.1 cytochrome b [Alphaproteobacteria bacterium]MBV9902373.1 cytochrome b [Alphaproteobacteria bacterium]
MTTLAAATGLGPERARYSRVAIWLHWAIAGLIVVNLLLGFFHEDFARPVRGTMMTWHKSIGFTVLALTVVRILWRLSHRPPAFDSALKRWETGLATAVHWLFYALLLAIPLSGWLIVSTGTKVMPTHFLWLFDIGPLPVTPGEGIHDLAEEAHELLGYAMLLLLVLHVGGAVKHHLDGHRHLIGRMAPWLYRER